MLQSYTFFDGGTIQFDDARPVSELICWPMHLSSKLWLDRT